MNGFIAKGTDVAQATVGFKVPVFQTASLTGVLAGVYHCSEVARACLGKAVHCLNQMLNKDAVRHDGLTVAGPADLPSRLGMAVQSRFLYSPPTDFPWQVRLG